MRSSSAALPLGLTNSKLSGRELLTLDGDVLLAQCDVDLYRASGPGGQKRNKTSSAVRLRHRPTSLAVTASEDRSQHVNKARAVRRLRRAIALHVRTEIDVAHYRASPLVASQLGSEGQTHVGRRDPRRWLVVAEVLDVLAACGTKMSMAARTLKCSTGRLVSFFRSDGKLWERVNQMRIEAGQKPLR